MTTLQTLMNQNRTMNQNPTNADVATPIKERACDALHAVLRSKPRPSGTESRLMRRGAERC